MSTEVGEACFVLEVEEKRIETLICLVDLRNTLNQKRSDFYAIA